MELTPVFLANKKPMHKSGKIVSTFLIKIIPESCTDLSLLALPLSPGKVLLSIMFTSMYLSLEGFVAFLRSSSAHCDTGLSLKSSRLSLGYICLLPWTIHHKEEDSWLLIMIESLTGWNPECNAKVNHFALTQKHPHPLVLVKDKLSVRILLKMALFYMKLLKMSFFFMASFFFFL